MDLQPEPLPMSDETKKDELNGEIKFKETEEVPFSLDLRSKDADYALKEDCQRFNFFLIDTGWNEPISKLVHKHFPRLLHHHNPKDLLFILTPEQSVEGLRLAPYMIGHDPIILVYDLYAPNQGKTQNYKGFRLALGLFRHPEQAMSRLQEFFRFLVIHRQSEKLDREIRRELHREGIGGMIKVLRESTPEIL
jgi:hypothetical protein